MSDDNLNIARRKLNIVLADKAPAYFTHMKHWFQMKSSKEKFDTEARKLLNYEQVHVHNEFLLALLNRVGGLAESSVSLAHERAFSYGKNRKPRVVTTTATPTASTSTDPGDVLEEIPRFDPVDLIDYLPPKSPQGAGCDGVKYVAQEVFLPDQALVVGRFMLAAWDHDLEGVEDDAANIVVVAVQMLLKNVLSAIISQRKPFKSRKGTFTYDSGADIPSLWLRNTDRIVEPEVKLEFPLRGFGCVGPRRPATIDEMEHTAALEMACSVPQEDEPITVTLEDVYLALQTNRNIIGSHTVYSVNMERIANMLCHPST